MDTREVQYLVEGVSDTISSVYDELYDSLVVKGKQRLGQQTTGDAPVISDLIKRHREDNELSSLLSRAESEKEELIRSIGAEIRKRLSTVGLVTQSDLARIQRRMDEIEQVLASRSS